MANNNANMGGNNSGNNNANLSGNNAMNNVVNNAMNDVANTVNAVINSSNGVNSNPNTLNAAGGAKQPGMIRGLFGLATVGSVAYAGSNHPNYKNVMFGLFVFVILLIVAITTIPFGQDGSGVLVLMLLLVGIIPIIGLACLSSWFFTVPDLFGLYNKPTGIPITPVEIGT